LFGIMRMNFEHVLRMPDDIFSAARLGADVVLGENPPSGENQGIAARRFFLGWNVFGRKETALATHELSHMHDRRAFGRIIIARPLRAADTIELVVTHT